MHVKLRTGGPRVRRPKVLAVVLLALSALGAAFVSAPAASADVPDNVTTLVANLATEWGPYTNSPNGNVIGAKGTSIWIECYVTGQSVSGPYGTENIWDFVVDAGGGWVPDADLYTGSNSPVVPSCQSMYGSATGQIIGGTAPVEDYPGQDTVAHIGSGEYVELECYINGPSASGPYGSEHVWDLLFDETYSIYEYVPDAQVYTGSNAAVVPQC